MSESSKKTVIKMDLRNPVDAALFSSYVAAERERALKVGDRVRLIPSEMPAWMHGVPREQRVGAVVAIFAGGVEVCWDALELQSIYLPFQLTRV